MKTIELKLFEEFNAVLNGYIHDEFARPCVIMCPGGGYMYLTEHESEPAALAYFAKGFNVFVCRYPIKEEAVYPNPQISIIKAVSLVRKHAEAWNIIPDRVVVAGFSAGAHVALCAGTLYSDERLLKLADTDKKEARPDAMILIYPCIGADIPGYTDELGKEAVLRCELLVDNDTPPAYIVTSFGDRYVSCNQSLNLARAMSDNDVPFELHCFEPGDHGVLNSDNMHTHDFTTRDIGMNSWFNMSVEWLRDRFEMPEVNYRGMRSHKEYYNIEG